MKIKCIQIGFLFSLLMLISGVSFCETVQVDQGSYTTDWPAYTGYGLVRPNEYFRNIPNTLYGPPLTIYKTANFTGPVPTNDWWTSVAWMRYSSRLFSNPVAYEFTDQGLDMTVQNNTLLNHASAGYWSWKDFTVKGTGLNPEDARLDRHTDWSTDIKTGDGTRFFTARMVTGSPYTYLTFENCEPVITFDRTPVYSEKMDGTVLTNQTLNTASVTTDTIRTYDNRGHYWGWFAPQGTLFQISGNTMNISLPAGQKWLVVGALTYAPLAQWDDPPLGSYANLNALHQVFYNHAYAWPTHTQVSWIYDRAQSEVRVNYDVTCSAKQYGQTVTIQGIFPHQYKNMSNNYLGLAFQTHIGQQKLLAANNYTIRLPYHGILPYMPMPNGGSFDLNQMRQYIDERRAEPIEGRSSVTFGHDDWLDSYWSGKYLANVTKMIPMAHLAGDSVARDQFKQLVRGNLEDWLTYQPHLNENADQYGKSFVYLEDWKGMFGFFPGYGSEHFTDHHFHYGYFIYNAALLSMFDPGFAQDYGGMVDLLVREIAAPNRNDTMFPFLRSMDVYHGHSWSNGIGSNFSGNDQESISEALNAWAGIAMWGAVTGNTAFEDLGVFLHALEYAAAREYWYDIDRDVYDHSTYNSTYVTSMVFGSFSSNGTWFSNEPEHRHGITYLPITPSSLYLGLDTTHAANAYQALLNEAGGELEHWEDIFTMYRAFSDPAGAIAAYDDSIDPETGNSWAFTYQFIHNLNNMGLVDASVTADVPLYAVFNKSGTRNYVAFNPTASSLTVHFSDGFNLVVPPNSMKTTEGWDIPVPPLDTVSPSQPTGLQATDRGDMHVDLTWNASTDNLGVADYRLFRDGALIKTVNGTQTTDTGLSPSTSYSYRVVAVDGAGNVSPQSTILSVTTLASTPSGGIPPIIFLDTFNGGGFRSFSLNTDERTMDVTDTSDPYAGTRNIRTYVKKGDHARYDLYFGTSIDDPGLDLSAYEAIEFYMKGSRITSVWARIGDGYHDSGYSLRKFQVGSTYQKYTLPLDNMNVGDASDINVLLSLTIHAIDNGILDHDLHIDNVVLTGGPAGDVETPTTPSNLSANSVNANRIDLNWQAATDNVGVTSYNIYRDGSVIDTSPTNSYSDTNLQVATTYVFQVSALDAAGNESGLSNSATVTSSDTTPPSVPEGVHAASFSTTEIDLSWASSTDNIGVTGYHIYRDNSYIATATDTNYRDSGLESSTTYSYEISAIDGFANESNRSSAVQGTTFAQSLQTPWQDHENGQLYVNRTYNYSMGYRFIPQANGRVYTLGGYFNGTKTIKLWDDATGIVLAQTDVTSNNNWVYAAVTPVSVVAGKSYTVAVFLAGSGGAYRNGITVLPQVYGDITITTSLYSTGDIKPTNERTTQMFGQVDIGFELETAPPNQPPQITSQPVTMVQAGDLYSYTLTANDADGDLLTYSLVTRPTGMTIGSSGEVQWSPQTGDTGNHTIIVKVVDGNGGEDTQTYTLTVTNPGGGTEQTPWQDNESGILSTNRSYDYTMGYHFTPQTDGTITKLSGHFNGTRTVYLWDDSSGALLTQADVTSSNDWQYTDITPISVQAGTSYTVAAYIAGSGGSYRNGVTAFPQTFEDIQITSSTFARGNNKPDTDRTTLMFGQVDISFLPGGTSGGNQAPVITTSAVLQTQVGANYIYDVDAFDLDGDSLTYSLTTSPSGMTINSTSGLLSWTPATGQDGSQPVVIRVVDGNGGEDTQAYTLTVTNPGGGTEQTPWQDNESGILFTNRSYDYTMGYHFTPQTDGTITKLSGHFNGTRTVYLWDDSSGALLTQADVTSSNDWQYTDITPISVQAGTSYTVAAYIAGSGGSYRSGVLALPQTFEDIQITASTFASGNNKPDTNRTTSMFGQVDISFLPGGTSGGNQAPVITTSAVLQTQVGANYIYDVDAFDQNNDPLAFNLDAFPSGMSIHAMTGIIAWTPTTGQEGSHSVVVRVVDGKGGEDIQSYTLEVIGASGGAEELPWQTYENGTLVIDRPFNYTMGYHFTPEENGTITKLGGFFNGSKKVSLWNRGTGQRLADTQVTSANNWQYAPISSVSVQAGTEYTVATYLGGSGGSYRSNITEFPRTLDNITILATTFIEGDARPTRDFTNFMYGQADIVFVPDSGGTENQVPVITSTPVTQVTEGESYVYDVEATDEDGDSLTFTLTTFPGGMTLNSTTGLISWSPEYAAIGDHAVTVSVEDGNNGVATQSFTVTVSMDSTSVSQYPWQSNANGVPFTDRMFNYTMGYHFTPEVDGQVTELGGFFNGTKMVTLWDDNTGDVLAQATVTAANDWQYTAITPVDVTAGTSYTVAVYLAGSGASYRSNIDSLPRSYGDVTITSSTYASGNQKPTSDFTATMHGQADICFIKGGQVSAEDPVYIFLKELQLPNGLVEETEGGNFVSLYANSLAAMVFTLQGDISRADQIFDFFNNRLNSEFNLSGGGFGQFRNAQGIPLTATPHQWMGDNAWLLIALNNYHDITGTQKYQTMATALEQWLRSLQDSSDGGLWGGTDSNGQLIGKNTEGNLDGFNAIAGYDGFHQDLADYLENNVWDSNQKNFLAWIGHPQYQYALDLHSWGFTAVPDMVPQILMDADRFLTTQTATANGQTLTGYCFDVDQDTIWMEGTCEMIVAFQSAGLDNFASTYLSEVEKLIIPAGAQSEGIPYASNQGTGFGTGSLWVGVDTNAALTPSAWYLMAKNGFDAMALGRNKSMPVHEKFWLDGAQASSAFQPGANQVLLMIGQEKGSIADYTADVGVTPGGLMVYTSIQNMEGIEFPSDGGGGEHHYQHLIEQYPHSVINLGLYMVGALQDVINGTYDDHIDKLGEWIKKSRRPVYLRIGYEFDFPANNYDPALYIEAYQIIHDRLQAMKVSNVAYVWHSWTNGSTGTPFLDWFPGVDYVDWFGTSYFDQTHENMDAFAALAAAYNKPLMIAEATPRGTDVLYGQTSWDDWFAGFFSWIAANNVKAVSYINWNWNEYSLFQNQGWPNARVQDNPIVKQNWLNEINQAKYLHANANLFQQLGYVDPLFQWIENNVSAQTGMPISFDIADSDRAAALSNMGEPNCVGGIVERVLVEEGINIYDGAVWQLALIARGTIDDLNEAALPTHTYWNGRLGGLSNIRAGSGSSQDFIYDPADPGAVSDNLNDFGQRGFIFRMTNAHGEYFAADPLDGKTTLSGFPNGDQIHWEDWKPIAGENAWVTMAACQLYHARYFDGTTGTYNAPANTEELQLAEELARAAQLLQSSVGGVRMAPINAFHSEGGPGTPCLPSGSPAADAYTWFYNEISTENNISWYAAFRMLHAITGKAEYQQAMLNIENYFQAVWSSSEGIFHQGMHYNEGSGQWEVNATNFATDVQTWSLAVLGSDTLDAWFGNGTAIDMWRSTRTRSGVNDAGGNLAGVGYTDENDRLSVEWTLGAMLALQDLESYYKTSQSSWADEAAADLDRMAIGITAYQTNPRAGERAFSYSSRRDWIPFGWYSHDSQVMSMASTGWVAFIEQSFNPFELPSY